jgi:hypothetical protein
MAVEHPAKDPERADALDLEDVLVLHLRAASDVRGRDRDLAISRHRGGDVAPPLRASPHRSLAPSMSVPFDNRTVLLK